MSESQAMLHEANRRAHRLADVAVRVCGWLDTYEDKLPQDSGFRKTHDDFHKAVVAYEEIEQRQQKEAAL